MSSVSSRVPLAAVLVVQTVVAYEWLNSALTKIVRGGFAAGLADQLAKNSDSAPGWYRAVLDTLVIPNAATFGYMIQAGELLVGIGLLATAVALFVNGQRLSVPKLRALLAVVAGAALAGAFMNLNFSLFSGDPPVWSLGSDAFSEGISIDGVLMLVQLAVAGSAAALVYSLRERRAIHVFAGRRAA